ncbi:polysaccharide biosynthesis/export family protein [Winogradskyella tangerina]|uniref:polysaccharide biosynthesis/export family protein n=1 Tax=Winogradskyella tangerina TaxID=2023240 RepID=UPI000DBE7873|nr:polysaccharide biosynthesis/export family protein [Winogradskyella tangerina]
MRKLITGIILLVFISSCASKKDILYLQDADSANNSNVNYSDPVIQPNDILKIDVATLVPEASIPYNKTSTRGAQVPNLQIMQIDGYLVSVDHNITFPVLGDIITKDLTTKELEKVIKDKLVSGGHLLNPTVSVRLINAKVTVLGEVNQPGTFTFTEQNITLLQALGYAGDLTINGKRDDILVQREVEGIRRVSHIDLTSVSFIDSEFYFIKPNDIIIVNPNNPRVKNAGFIGNAGTVLTIASLALSITILLSR